MIKTMFGRDTSAPVASAQTKRQTIKRANSRIARSSNPFPEGHLVQPRMITLDANLAVQPAAKKGNLDIINHYENATLRRPSNDSDVSGPSIADAHFQFEDTPIKRSKGQHEIVGFHNNDWIEEGRSTPDDSSTERNATENCTVHLIRRPA
jgi:hypothetical protein